MMSLFRSGAVLILSILLLEVSRTRAKARIGLPKNFYDEVKTRLSWSVSENDWPEVKAEIKNAFDFWENHTRFTFEEVPPGNSRESIRIHIFGRYENTYSLVTEDNITETAVAHTIFDPREQSGVVFVTGYEIWKRFSNRNKNALNITSVLKHQLGYILGQKNTTVFSSIITPSYQITNITLMREERAPFFFAVNAMTVIKESYKMPQDFCKANIDVQLHNIDIPYGSIIGKYLYNNVSGDFAPVRDYWPQVPDNLTKIDGVYGDPRGFQVFFIGKQAYTITNTESLVVPSYFLNIWLKAEDVDHVDFVFGYDTGMYVVKGQKCWKFNQTWDYNYTVRIVKVDFSSSSGYKEAIIEGKHYKLEWDTQDRVTFDWLGFACQLGQKGLVPPECCNF